MLFNLILSNYITVLWHFKKEIALIGPFMLDTWTMLCLLPANFTSDSSILVQ